jgi:hypothetical protein
MPNSRITADTAPEHWFDVYAKDFVGLAKAALQLVRYYHDRLRPAESAWLSVVPPTSPHSADKCGWHWRRRPWRIGR